VLQGLAAICYAVGNGGYIGSHCPKQSRASSLLGGEFLASVAREVELEVTTYRSLPTPICLLHVLGTQTGAGTVRRNDKELPKYARASLEHG